MSVDVYALPPDLPAPEDDGAADHVDGLELPGLALESSAGAINVRDTNAAEVVAWLRERA